MSVDGGLFLTPVPCVSNDGGCRAGCNTGELVEVNAELAGDCATKG